MANIVVVGAQWGDEGKGKIVDLLTEHFDIVARYQGGHNAGHTVSIGDKRHVLHLIPSGILHPGKICVIGNGVVVDLAALKQEIQDLEAAGISCRGRLFVSNRAHLILDYHRAVERASEEGRQGKPIGTTLRGIGPAYEDKMGRRGVRICDVMADPAVFRDLLEENLRSKSRHFPAHVQATALESLYTRTLALAGELSEHFVSVSEILNRAMDEGKGVLFEGAQGALLDVDHGTYPFVTASSATAGGACTGTGVGPTRMDCVVGITKAYTTRVGGGPFPTELTDALGEDLRKLGMEYGASTGRPRRCGWFDAVVVRYASMINGLNSLVVTKLDVLDQLKKIQVCTGYRHKGQKLTDFPADIRVLEECTPEYETLPGWMERTAGIREHTDLPKRAHEYLARLSELVRTEISIVSTGPERDQTIFVPGSKLQRWF